MVLYEDMYNVDKHGKFNQLQCNLDEIETKKARDAAIGSRVKWQKIGDKCTTDFVKSYAKKTHSQLSLN